MALNSTSFHPPDSILPVKPPNFQAIGQEIGKQYQNAGQTVVNEARKQPNHFRKSLKVIRGNVNKMARAANKFCHGKMTTGQIGKITKSKAFKKGFGSAYEVAKKMAPNLPYYSTVALALKLINLGLQSQGRKGIPNDPVALAELAVKGAAICKPGKPGKR